MMWQGTFTIGIFWGMYIYRQRQLHTYSDPNLNSSSKKERLLRFWTLYFYIEGVQKSSTWECVNVLFFTSMSTTK